MLCAAAPCCVFTLGVVTDNAIADVVQNHDKLVHFVAFFTESCLFVHMLVSRVTKFPLWRTEEGGRRYICISKYTLGLVVCLTAALSSEFLQKTLSKGRRTFDPLDMVYNVMGTLSGVAAVYYWE